MSGFKRFIEICRDMTIILGFLGMTVLVSYSYFNHNKTTSLIVIEEALKHPPHISN
jgi:hypothetical protein